MDNEDALNIIFQLNCFIEIVPVTTLVSGKSCGVIFFLSCYLFTANFNGTHYRLGKHVHFTLKHILSCKNKGGYLIFRLLYF